MNTVADMFLSSVREFADHTAVVEDSRRFTYGEIGQMAESLCSFLISKGVVKGDRVAIFLPNSIEFVVSFFAAALAGAVSVPINSAYKEEEVEFYIRDSAPKIIITEENLKQIAEKSLSHAHALIAVVRGRGAEWDNSRYEAGAPVSADVKANDEAIYLYSTGSTGKPKRVMRTHLNLTALADNHTSTVGWTEKDRILFTIPISHTYGFGNFISAVKIGAGIVVTGEFNRNKVLDVLEKEAITVFPAVPVMIDVLAKTFLPEPKDLSLLKLVISAGAPLKEETFHRFREKFSICPRQLYGSTETGVISINLGEDIEKRFDSVGRAVSNVVVKVLNESGNEVTIGEVGEIAVRSPSMTTGYHGLPEETAKVFRNGYYFTGDLGRIDEDGYLYIVGRKKLLINVGGYKVDPTEVENLLLRHSDVGEAAVLCVQDESGNERIKAVIVPSGPVDVKEITDFCRGKIADYKIPHIFEFRSELPRSPTGKVLRERLK